MRHLGILSVACASLLGSFNAIAQTPAAPTPVYTGSLGGGLAVTNGNTDTRTFNLTGTILRDPQTKNVLKATASYLRGNQSSVSSLDQTSINVRDEYTVSSRTFVFSQLDYLRDQFKQIVFFWVPSTGVGYKLINTDLTQFNIDGGTGAVIEKNPGKGASRTGNLSVGERFQRKLTTSATLTEKLTSVWKVNNFGDSLTNFSIGLTTTVTGKIQLKVEFADSYKNKPPSPSVKKNDTTLLTTFVMKF
jgi:putative salt-induced outer membrane protein